MDQISTVVTKREDGVDKTVMARTPTTTAADVRVVALPWWAMIGVRIARVYLFGVVGLLTPLMVGSADAGIPPSDFLSALERAALWSIGPAVISLLTNTLEILTKLDITRPELRA